MKKTLLGLMLLMSPLLSHARVTDRVILDNLESPWAVVTAPDNTIWITEQDVGIRIFDRSYKPIGQLTGLPGLVARGQGGVLDIAFHPQFLQNGIVFIAYTVSRETGMNTRVNEFKFTEGKLTNHRVLLEGPGGEDSAHFGCRLLVTDQYLFATFGERHHKELAQDTSKMNGKIARLNLDGSIPADNPFGNSVFSYGHRNPQGLDVQPGTGVLYNSEHGPSGYDAPGGGDEINKIEMGANYGWPVIHHRQTRPGMVTPLKEYTPSIAPSGVVFYTGDRIPQWRNDFFVATLAGDHVLRLRISKTGQVTQEERLLDGRYGRIRDVGNAPDGSLLVLSEDGKLIQLVNQ